MADMTQFLTRKSDKRVFPVNPTSSKDKPSQEVITQSPEQKDKELKEKERQKNLPPFVKNEVLTEQQFNLLKRRLDDNKINQQDIFGKSFSKSFKLTPEQTKKGFDFLDNRRRTPRGVERKNNPFGAREEAVLDNFDRFEVTEFFDAGNQFVKFHVPLFTVIAKDGSTFQYHFSGGKVNIVG